jgi:hypothetical protein
MTDLIQRDSEAEKEQWFVDINVLVLWNYVQLREDHDVSFVTTFGVASVGLSCYKVWYCIDAVFHIPHIDSRVQYPVQR